MGIEHTTVRPYLTDAAFLSFADRTSSLFGSHNWAMREYQLLGMSHYANISQHITSQNHGTFTINITVTVE